MVVPQASKVYDTVRSIDIGSKHWPEQFFLLDAVVNLSCEQTTGKI